MSRIAFTGNALGTGTVTIASPNTNSDRTVTLPDETGTIVLSGGALGTPSSGNGSNLTNLNASNLATGTVPTARLASGSATSSTYLRGDQTWASVAGYSGPQAQAFTGNGTFTIPAGVTAVKVTVVGGGAGGTGTNSNASGGGAGGTAIRYLTSLTPGATLSVTIGGGGGGSTGTASAGGTSSVASGTQTISTISATGGSSAVSVQPSSSGAGGVGSGGTLNISGGAGNANGAGGSSTLGGGGVYRVNTTGGTGGNYGGGGGGGNQANCGSYSGGAGAAGVVIFEW